MSEWMIGSLAVSLIHGGHDDSDLDLVIRTKDITVGVDIGGSLTSGGSTGRFGISVQESSAAANVVFWPSLSMTDLTRRETIYSAAKGVLDTAENLDAKGIGFYTLGLEVSKIPSWEVAEEIVRAVVRYSKNCERGRTIYLVASSPIQVSSFQYALNNAGLFTT